MNLKQVTLNNSGMQQDLSISKDGKDFAYKNVNIRIQATGDGTLASVTNLKSPELKSETPMIGKVLNSIMCGKYIVVFTHSHTIPSRTSAKDRIYRIDLEDNFTIRTLYEGDLNFSLEKPIDSTYYYENDKVQKVYWVDGWTTNGSNNYPRVINIITEGERNGSTFTPYDANTNFDFYPELKYVPVISAVKNFDVPSELPSGMIQYFVSFFNKNQSETLIAAGTSLYSIDLKNRGAAADKTGCAFNITVNIQNESTAQGEWLSSYEYIRLYSVRRTSLNGDATVNIVQDFKIEPNVESYTVLDNGMGQETIDPGQIFFVGGTPLFAKTLCQKDNTLFVGGIKTEGVLLDESIKTALAGTIVEHKDAQDTVILEEAGGLDEDTKVIPVSDHTFNSYYPYKLQKDNESIDIRTFKVGEIYRFGIQFQTKHGQWSEIAWIGDKKIANRPVYNNDPDYEDTYDTFSVSNIKINQTLRGVLSNIISGNYGFTNYRLVMADPEYSNGRSILAQGVVCPTMFVPSLRTQNAPHTINSWIMRPRNGSAPYHHLEPLESAKYINSELSTYDPNESIGVEDSYPYYTMPFEFVQAGSSEFTKTNTDNNFYIDESIVSLFSPEITENTIVKGSIKFRLVGYAPLTSNYSDVEVTTKNTGIDLDYVPGVYSSILNKYKVPDGSTNNIKPLYADYLYLAPKWWTVNEQNIGTIYPNLKCFYNIHMWQHSKSILGFNILEDKVLYPGDTESTELVEEPLVLERNSFYNHLFSKYTNYLNNSVNYNLDFGVGLYKNDGNEQVGFKFGEADLYAGSIDTIHTNTETHIYSKNETSGPRPGLKTTEASSRITFNSIPHVVFYLGLNKSRQLRLLPIFDSNSEVKYSGIFTGKYPIDRITGGIYYPDTPSIWKNIKTDSESDSEREIRDFFTNNLESVGVNLGASWIKNFAIYEQAADTSAVYDSVNGYKTCGAIVLSVSQGEDFYNKIRSLIQTLFVVTESTPHPVLENYNYKETIGNTQYTVLIAIDESGHTDNAVVKCYWSNINNNINIVELSEDEINKAYIYLYSASRNYAPIWEGRDPLPSGWKYRFVYPYKAYNRSGEYRGIQGDIRDLDSFNKFSGNYIYTQDTITEPGTTKPYLFVGELYYDIPYSSLYGGYSKEDLSKLTWTPISKTTPLSVDVDKTEGDTYYQRWDCLKTFPKTTEDTNQVVDITSFMVETHINLDERTDPNRANFNMVVNPTNFNLFNGVYNQKNNLFSYTTINELMSEENSHQVSWSLTKNIAGAVDTWTNITSANTVNLKHPVTKLVNFNNKVVGLTKHSVEIVNFNARNLVPTDDNTFIELKNSAKVDGTIDFTIDKGTRNMSVLVTEAGLYFIDDNENSLIRINYNGEIKNLGTGKMDSWFKQNITPGTYSESNGNAFHLEYDAKFKDIYICNDTSVLVYNETLDSFTSFVDYQELVSLFTNKGSTYAIAAYPSEDKNNRLYEMYNGGDYGHGFNDKDLPYSIQYRVNPGPYSDKVFTNVEFRADLGVSQENKSTSNVQPFDTIKAWTEYQDTGVQPLVYDRLHNLREKFRTWRALIPRNEHTRDRIRNPWMHLKLDKPNVNGQKLEFHNISITYME